MNDQYAAEMTSFPLLQGFTLAGAQMLMESGKLTRYSPGEMLFKEGDPSSFTLLVLSGTLEVFLARQAGEVILREPGPGTILGELGVLCGFPRSASVRAKSDAVALQWQATEFRRVLVRHTLFADRVMGQSLRNLIEKERSLVDSLTRDQPAG
jgi:CRP/FNR family transcriptional regulator, cyclic AMP receptor protein